MDCPGGDNILGAVKVGPTTRHSGEKVNRVTHCRSPSLVRRLRPPVDRTIPLADAQCANRGSLLTRISFPPVQYVPGSRHA